MEKKLLRSEKDLIKFFLQELGDFNIVENVLDIEFPFEDGTYHSNPPKSIQDSDDEYEQWEAQETRTDVFKASDDAQIPEQYPCIVLFSSVDDGGSYGFNIIEYVYLKDFEG